MSRKCCGDQEPSFYYVWVRMPSDGIRTMCSICIDRYISKYGWSKTEVFDNYNRNVTKAFHTYEEAELYLIKARL